MGMRNIISYLRDKNKLSMRNVRTGQEIWHVFISRFSLFLALLAFLLVVFVGVLVLVAYTPVMDLIPGYPGSKSREVLLQNIMRLDSLSAEVTKWDQYHTNFARILDGQLPLTETDTTQREGVRGSVTGRTGLDSVLREQMTEDGSIYRLEDGLGVRRRTEVTFEMLPPTTGLLARPFSPTDGLYGVEIAASPNQGVLSVLDGTVILTTWDPSAGNTVTVQHGGNIVSVYKQVGELMKRTGDRIRAGEAVALTRPLGDRAPNVIFEVWYNGTAVDPENYIVF